MEREKNK